MCDAVSLLKLRTSYWEQLLFMGEGARCSGWFLTAHKRENIFCGLASANDCSFQPTSSFSICVLIWSFYKSATSQMRGHGVAHEE